MTIVRGQFLKLCSKMKDFKDFRLVWALDNPEKFILPDRAVVVKDYSISFFVHALKAKSGSQIRQWNRLCFKKSQLSISIHGMGSAIKYLGNDVKTEGKYSKEKAHLKEKAFYTQSEFDEYVLRELLVKKMMIQTVWVA